MTVSQAKSTPNPGCEVPNPDPDPYALPIPDADPYAHPRTECEPRSRSSPSPSSTVPLRPSGLSGLARSNSSPSTSAAGDGDLDPSTNALNKHSVIGTDGQTVAHIDTAEQRQTERNISTDAYRSQDARRAEVEAEAGTHTERGQETDEAEDTDLLESDSGTGGDVHPNADADASLRSPQAQTQAARPSFFVDDSTNDTIDPSIDPSIAAAASSSSSSPAKNEQETTTEPIVPSPTTMAMSTSSNEGYEPLDTPPPAATVPPHTPSRPSSPSSPTPPPRSPRTPPVTQPPSPPIHKPLPSRPHPTHTPNPNPPPSSFAYTYAAAFPFQAYAGNPDPGFSIPGFTSRRRSGTASSLDSFGGYNGGMGFGIDRDRDREREREREDALLPHSGSLSDLRKPFAPFMAGAGAGENNSTSSSTSLNGTIPRSSSSNSLYKHSAAGNLNSNSFNANGGGGGACQGTGVGQGQGQGQQGGHHNTSIPRNSSTHSFRAPFLAPSSRPTSSLWSPPTYNGSNSPNPNTNPTNGNGNGNGNNTLSPNASTTALGLAAYPPTHIHTHAVALAKAKPPLPSTLLRAPIPLEEKPWLLKPSTNGKTTGRGPSETLREAAAAAARADGQRASLSYWLTLLLILLGAVASAIQCYTGLTSVNAPIPDSQLCLVMDDEFTGGGGAVPGLDTDNNWNLDLELGGYGNGEFEMTTSDPSNIYTNNGELVIMPTLTSDKVQGVLDGGSFTLSGCTSGGEDGGIASLDPGAGNKANGGLGGGGGVNGTGACSVASSDALGTVINPVQSARINTRGKKSIRFGKVEVRAKLPRGDWLWPQIFLLPTEPSTYGAWPVSGELDLLLARGNDPSAYPAQGNTFVRSSLSFGPLPNIASSSLLHTTFGFLGNKHPNAAGGKGGYTTGFHTYTLEWTEEFIRFSVDRPTRAVLEVSTRARRPQFGFGAKAVEGRSYWNQAGFPEVARGVGGGGGGAGAGGTDPNANGNTTTTTTTNTTDTTGGSGTSQNATDPSGNNNSTTGTNATANTNTNIARALSHFLPVIANTTHTNSSSSNSNTTTTTTTSSSSTPNLNPNPNTNPEDTITPITNPYTSVPSSTPAAPFDQPFYLVVSLAVGGTSGWFPDGVGGKMWFDGSGTAMRDFARAQDTWYPTWPTSAEDRALRIDYIKMWELC